MDDMSSSQEANERECFASQKASKEFSEKHLFLTSNKMQNNRGNMQKSNSFRIYESRKLLLFKSIINKRKIGMEL